MAGLFNSTILDVAIGLAFIYLLLAILCTAANELIAGLLSARAKMLKEGIEQLLGNQPIADDKSTSSITEQFYEHPLIKSMRHKGHYPSYISDRIFAAVITDLITADKPGAIGINDLQAGIASMSNSDLKLTLLALMSRSPADLQSAQEAIEAWFNDAMDRVTGWYKRKIQVLTLLVALFLTLAANADTIHIGRRLWTDPVLRSAVVEEAKTRAQKPRPSISVEYPDENDPTNPAVTRHESAPLSDQERTMLGQMLGWRGSLRDNTAQDWFERILGWILTILAISLGAPFWFDLLNKFVNIRSNGKSPDERAKKPEKETAPARA